MESHVYDPLGLPEPRVLASFRRGFGALWVAPASLLVMALVAFGMGGASWHLLEHAGATALAGVLLGGLVAAPLAWSLDYLCLRAVRGDPIERRHVRRFKRHYADIVLANAVVTLMVVGGLFLLVVPGVALYCRLRFAPYLVIDEGLSASAALRGSVDLTRGHGWRIFWISLLGLGLFFLGLPALVIGAALGDLLARLATASFYHATVEGSREIAPGDDGWADELEVSPV